MGALRNPKHELFAQGLAKGLSAADAYSAAGFKPSAANARKLKATEAVRTRVEALLTRQEAIVARATEKLATKLALTKEYVIERLMEVADRCMQHKPVIGPDGEPTGEYKFEASGANKALELLGKVGEVGLFVERQEHDHKGRVAVERIERVIADAPNPDSAGVPPAVAPEAL